MMHSYLAPPRILNHPDSKLVGINTSVTVRCKGSSKRLPISYQWEARSSDAQPWMNITGSFNAKLKIKAVQSTTQLRCKASNEVGTAVSHVATITVFSKS